MRVKDDKKLAVAAAAAVLLLNVMEFVLHGIILQSTYHKFGYMYLWNTPNVMDSRRPAAFVAYLIAGIAFAKVYAQGYEESKAPMGQGIRYGFWIGLMAPVVNALLNYMVYPVSGKLAGAWVMGGMVECLILGVVVALIYQPDELAGKAHTH